MPEREATENPMELDPKILEMIQRRVKRELVVFYQVLTEGTDYLLKLVEFKKISSEEARGLIQSFREYFESLCPKDDEDAGKWLKFLNSPEAGFEYFLKTKGFQK